MTFRLFRVQVFIFLCDVFVAAITSAVVNDKNRKQVAPLETKSGENVNKEGWLCL